MVFFCGKPFILIHYIEDRSTQYIICFDLQKWQLCILKVMRKSEEPKGAWYDLGGQVNDFDSKEYLLSRSESEKRLNLLCAITSIGLLICATAFVLICFRIYAPPTIVYYENKISIKTHSSQPNIQ